MNIRSERALLIKSYDTIQLILSHVYDIIINDESYLFFDVNLEFIFISKVFSVEIVHILLNHDKIYSKISSNTY
jgi:hypothetical protein